MNLVLIQPPDPPPPVLPKQDETLRLFGPPWELLSLRSYLLQRTRHPCTLIDCRLQSDYERELPLAIRQAGEVQVAVVNTASLALGETAAMLDIIKRHFPSMVTAVCGQHSSQFPGQARTIPRADYVLAGDPEPILRNLLECMDVPQRLRHVPGLMISGADARPAYWLDDLKSLSLPDWTGVFWQAYEVGDRHVCRALIRLSRGHTRCPADRSFGLLHEPFRVWPMDRMAQAIQKCGHLGVNEVCLCDPPGLWTPARLAAWCAELKTVRNVQPWAFQLLPTHLSDDTVRSLAQTLCRRVEFLLPSCDPAVLQLYGCVLTPKELAGTMAKLERAGIRPHARIWLGGPENRRGEAERAIRMIHKLRYRSYSLHAFPLTLDSPLYHDHFESTSTHVNDWVKWSIDPWLHERPLPLWGGIDTAARIETQIAHIEKSIRHDPKRVVSNFARSLFHRNWIGYLEETALGMMPVKPPER